MANAAFLAEKSAKEVAETKLTTLRRSVAHKDELLKTLKTKVPMPASTVKETFPCLKKSPSTVSWNVDQILLKAKMEVPPECSGHDV